MGPTGSTSACGKARVSNSTDNAGGATQVRMVTPQGTNRFKGSVYEYNRNSRFAANTFFNKRANLPVAI